MKVLVTGGAGFIGSHYVKMRLAKPSEPKVEITVLDKLTYAGSTENLQEVANQSNFNFIQGDICNEELVNKLIKDFDQVIHFAAESHVDNSIKSSEVFVKTNVQGTNTLLNALKENPKVTFLHVSTDEVYGSISEGSWDEKSPLMPNSPYAASKASSDLLALAYNKTYGLDIRISRCCNNYGPNQFPEKVIPLFITNLLNQKRIPLYGTGSNFREWIHVNDHCKALDLILEKGSAGNVYNIGSDFELSNLDLAKAILGIFQQSEEMIDFVQDRLGHDFRYSLNSNKIKELGFKCEIDFKDGLRETVNWYKDNENWWASKINS